MSTITPNNSDRPTGKKGFNPEWAKLPKRHCDDCGKLYKPFRPRKKSADGTSEELGFCSDNCRKSYHKHGGAYRKLKVEVRKMVEKEINDLALKVRTLVHLEMGHYFSPDGMLIQHRNAAVASPLPNPQPRA